ncbi:hypothetical protein HGRIS_000438 [Hohenbuehelia grisea]|uniref:G-protein coupled receptors family 2 profile 2 domain-containing protein n=1 Tax=Hohenbuehelia grisea TaxID=104357 RepID=A0ABR3JR85_9AGAR
MNPSLIDVSNACLIAGLVVSSIVLAIAWLSPRVTRISTWFNLLLSGIIFDISYMLIIGAQRGSQPGFGICLFSAMMTYAAPALTAYAYAAFCLELFFLARYAQSPTPAVNMNPGLKACLLGIPYFIHLGIAMEVLVIGLTDRSRVHRDEDTSLYCHLEWHNPAKVTAGLSLVAIIIALFALGFTIRALYRNPRDPAMKLFRETTKAHRMVIRIAIFSVLPVIGLLFSVLKFRPRTPASGVFVIIFSLFPLWSAIVLGSQADIFRALMFWKSGASSSFSVEPRGLPEGHGLSELGKSDCSLVQCDTNDWKQ